MQKEQKRRQKNEPPKKLAELIHFENLLPSDFKFAKIYSSNRSDEENAKRFQKIKNKLPTKLQDLISDSYWLNEENNYCALAENLTMLKRTAEFLMFEMEKIKEHKNLPLEQQIKRKESILKFWKRFESQNHEMFSHRNLDLLRFNIVRTRIDSHPYFNSLPNFGLDYKVSFRSIYLMDLLKGIDARRLRLCENCSHVFWAFRLDKRCCSTECGNALKMRDYRTRKKQKSE